MTTLDTLIKQRLEEFDKKIHDVKTLEGRVKDTEKAFGKCPATGKKTEKVKEELENARAALEEAQRAEDDKIQYLLDTVPFIREYVDDDEDADDDAHDEKVPITPSALENFVDIVGTNNKNKIFYKYLATVEKVIPHVQVTSTVEHDICKVCDNRLVFHVAESRLVCHSCGLSKNHIEISSRNLTYDEEVTMGTRSTFCYKRLNHLVEWLNSLQGKENTTVPEELVDAVKNEFKKNRLTSKKDITAQKVKAFLKKLGLSKWYEHSHHIANTINGVPTLRLPEELETRLKSMFVQIQGPFQKHCPPARKNFLNYGYTLYKMTELLNEDEYLPLFPLLKSKMKIHAQDQIWKKICEELHWEYIPTV